MKLHNFDIVASDQAFTHDDMLNQTIFMPDWKQNSYILCNCICVSMTTLVDHNLAQPTKRGILLPFFQKKCLTLKILQEVLMFSQKCRNRSGVASKLFRHWVLLLQDTSKDIFAVMEVLVEFFGGFQHLSASVDQLAQICPSIIQGILPLCNGGSIWNWDFNRKFRKNWVLLHTLGTEMFALLADFSTKMAQEEVGVTLPW